MTHNLILKVKKFQLSSAKRFGTVEEKPPGGFRPAKDHGKNHMKDRPFLVRHFLRNRRLR